MLFIAQLNVKIYIIYYFNVKENQDDIFFDVKFNISNLFIVYFIQKDPFFLFRIVYPKNSGSIIDNICM